MDKKNNKMKPTGMNNRESQEKSAEPVSLDDARIKKHVLELTDSDNREAVIDFLKRFKNDTLTGY